MIGDGDSENDVSTTRTNNHKWPYSSFFSNVFVGGSQFMQLFLLKCLNWRLLSHIAVYCPFPSAHYFSTLLVSMP